MHGAFGFACGARGVNQNSQIRWLAGSSSLFYGTGVRDQIVSAKFAQAVQAHDARVIQAAQAVHVKYHYFAQTRQLRAHRQGFVQLLVVFNKQDRCIGVLTQVLHLRGRVGGVNATGYSARRQHSQICKNPVDNRIGQNGGAVTFSKAYRHQAGGNFPYRNAGLVPRPAAPQTQVFLPHPDVWAALGYAIPKHGWHGLALQNDVAARLNV